MKIEQGGRSVPASEQEVKMYASLEAEFNRKYNHMHERVEHLNFRIKQLEATVARFQQIFSAIVQDEVLRKFRESSENKTAGQYATERSW